MNVVLINFRYFQSFGLSVLDDDSDYYLDFFQESYKEYLIVIGLR